MGYNLYSSNAIKHLSCCVSLRSRRIYRRLLTLSNYLNYLIQNRTILAKRVRSTSYVPNLFAGHQRFCYQKPLSNKFTDLLCESIHNYNFQKEEHSMSMDLKNTEQRLECSLKQKNGLVNQEHDQEFKKSASKGVTHNHISPSDLNNVALNRYCHSGIHSASVYQPVVMPAQEHNMYKVYSIAKPSKDTKLAGTLSVDGDLAEVATIALKCDKLIAVPTDTIYGIASLAQSSLAVTKIYQVKKRDAGKPISICVGRIEDVYKWGKVTISKELLSRLLPGPVTVVFERTADLNPDLNPGTKLVGIRIPNYPFVVDIATKCGGPIALTSANLSSEPSSLQIKEFSHLFPSLSIIFDGGHLGALPISRQGSTIVDLSKHGLYKIIRPGSALDDTLMILHEHGLKDCDDLN